MTASDGDTAMGHLSYRRKTCVLCAGDELEIVFRLAATPVADHFITREQLKSQQPIFPLDLGFCRTCAHVQLMDVVNPDFLFKDYVYATSTSLNMVKHFEVLSLELIDTFAVPEGSLVVDIGSNDGSLLKAFQARGMVVLGIDPATRTAELATAAGIETWARFYDEAIAADILEAKGKASVVTANNVFAHSDHLFEMARGVRKILADDAIFVFEVSYLPHIIDRNLFDTIYHEHISYHTVIPLRSFLHRADLEIFDAVYIPTKGGSLRAFAQIRGGSRKISPNVADLVGMEKKRGFNKPEAYKMFARNVDTAKAACIALATTLRNEGKRMAGYGASPTTTTLTYHFELADFLDCLIDDNPIKQHRFSPGLHMPVLPKDALAEREIDVAVILAWNYADPIIRNNKEFIARGGQFAIPMPAARLCSE